MILFIAQRTLLYIYLFIFILWIWKIMNITITYSSKEDSVSQSDKIPQTCSSQNKVLTCNPRWKTCDISSASAKLTSSSVLTMLTDYVYYQISNVQIMILTHILQTFTFFLQPEWVWYFKLIYFVNWGLIFTINHHHKLILKYLAEFGRLW